MRTTITLDDEIARRLQDEMRARGTSFRQTLESVLLQGLNKRSGTMKRSKFEVEARSLGLKPGIDPARIQDLDTDLEIERFLQVTRKLEGEQ